MSALGGVLARDLELGGVVSLRSDRLALVAAAVATGLALEAAGLRRILRAGVAGLAVLWVAVALLGPVARAMCEGLVRRDPPQAADAVFVLGSAVQEDGDLTPDAASRLLHGFELIGQRLAPRLVLSELGPPLDRHAATAAVLLSRLGLEAELVAIGPVRTTRDEAVLLGRLCRERGFRRVLMVTSPLHSRRAASALEREGVTVVSSPGMETRFDLEGLRRPSHRLMAFGAALHERLGLLVYGWRGWLGPGGGR